MARKRRRGKYKGSKRNPNELLAVKIWFDSAGALKAVAEATGESVRLMSIDLRQKARRQIMGNRKDNDPFPRNVISKTTGLYKKNSIARPAGKPPRFYAANSLNQIRNAPSGAIAKVSGLGLGANKQTVTYNSSWLSGPIRDGTVTGKMIKGMTVARKTEYGGSQSRYFRMVPAVKHRGKRPAEWDGSTYRVEFTNDPSKMQSTQAMRKMWYVKMLKRGLISENPTAEHEIPFVKKDFRQSQKPYMRTVMPKVVKNRMKYLRAAKSKFPELARKYIKIRGEGYSV